MHGDGMSENKVQLKLDCDFLLVIDTIDDDKYITIMNRQKIKREILALLNNENITVILNKLDRYNEKEIINPLFSAICRVEDRIRWHAVSGFGLVVPKLAGRNMEDARVVMRRFMWNLNDESGGIGWGTPEAMGEIIYQHDQLAEEYLHMLLSYCREDGPELFQDGNFLELPQLQRGLLWAIARIAEKRREVLIDQEIVKDLLPYLQSGDEMVCAMAICSLGRLKAGNALEKIREFVNDERKIVFYTDGCLSKITVADMALKALMKLQE